MLELLLQFIAEFVLQIFGEALVEIGLRSLAEPFRARPNPWFAALGYAVFGCAAGGVSLLVFRQHLTAPGVARVVNLVLTPAAVGACMAALGAWRARQGEPVLRIERFIYGYLFALGLALTRFCFAT